MNTVIKSSDLEHAPRVRALSLEPPPPTTPSPEALKIAGLEARLAVAWDEAAALSAQEGRLRAEAGAAFAQGREAGLMEGQRRAEDRSAALLAEVTRAASNAATAFQDRLKGFEAVTAELASLALSRIADMPDVRKALVTGTVHRALAETVTGAVVRIEVSKRDFPDASALTQIETAGAQVLAVDQPSGTCRIILQLGEIDLGLDGQIARLRELMESLT